MFQLWPTAVTLAIAIPCLSWESQAQDPQNTDPTPPTLDALVDQHFRTDDVAERTKLVSSIEKTAESSIEAVATAIRRVMVWEPLPGTDLFAVETASPGRVNVLWKGFNDPDPTPARPLVLCLPADDEREDIPNRTLNRAVMTLGPAFYNACLLAAVSRSIGGSFHQHPAEADDLRRIIRELRRRIHLDTDRLYLFGFHEGGAAAWMASLFQPDLFAGLIVVASYPKLPFPQQVYPLLLPNLKDIPLLVIAPHRDETDAAGLSVLDAHLDAILEPARLNSLPMNKAIVPFDDGKFGAVPRWNAVKDAVAVIRDQTRVKPSRTVSHWFRYPAQGEIGWLRAVKTYGDVWTDDQLSISVAPATDRDTFVTDVFKDKLFHIGGRVVGQTIHIETKRIADVELRIFDGMLDFAKPITVIINGRKRHEGLIKPNIATMLESAFEDWEFQRLVFAKLAFSIRSDSSGE